jgi:hypothetical protein
MTTTSSSPRTSSSPLKHRRALVVQQVMVSVACNQLGNEYRDLPIWVLGLDHQDVVDRRVEDVAVW